MIQSHFVRLEPPYQVIFCNGQVGIQIGSLIVVEEKRGPNEEYGLLTHTHPVVSYGSKDMLDFWTRGSHDIWMSNGDFVQGAVWEKAEVKDVLVIGLLGTERQGTLNEKGFSELVFRTLENKIQQGLPIQNTIRYLNRNLNLIGMAPRFHFFEEVDFEMDLCDYQKVPFVTFHDAEYNFQMAIPYDTMPEMKRMVWDLVREYECLYDQDSKTPAWHFTYAWESQLPELVHDDGTPIEEEITISQLAKELNKLQFGNK